jgi:hypothetical protein
MSLGIAHGVVIDYSRDKLFDELGKTRLRESYMKEEEESPQERFAYVANAFGSNSAHAQRLYEYASKHWLSFSTPILSFGRSRKGLPISCFVPETLIQTDQGTKQLGELKLGDMVLSHDGTYNSVKAIKESISDDLYELEFQGETFNVTGNHQILTQLGWVRVDELDSDVHVIERVK